jgi:hypothetical protein
MFKDVVLPKEHGSWSLAFEPIALGLFIAPSPAGALLALALSAGFFARRPLRIGLNDPHLDRRATAQRALIVCAITALLSMTGAVLLGGVAWLVWLVPVAIAGAIFESFDRKGAGREEAAEIAGSAAFAMVPAALAILGGLNSMQALALALLALGRSVPSVLCVRAYLRAKKTSVHRNGPALVSTCSALAITTVLYDQRLVSLFAFTCMVVLAVRAFALLSIFRPTLRARTLGMCEAVLGLVFVLGVALTWGA